MSTVLSPPTSLWCADGLKASIDGPGLQRAFSLDRPYALVGASPRCDIVVPILETAPVALYLHATDEAIYWLDLSSPTGQWRSGAFGKNGCLVWRGYHLALERICGEGAMHSTANQNGEQRNDEHRNAANRNAAFALPDDRLEDAPVFDVHFDDRKLARAKLTHPLTLVGNSPRCRLRLHNRHVSADHCLFHASGRQAWVVDLLGREGTFVNGQRVAASAVELNDVVTLGKPTLTMLRWRSCKPAADESDAADALLDESEELEEADLVAPDVLSGCVPSGDDPVDDDPAAGASVPVCPIAEVAEVHEAASVPGDVVVDDTASSEAPSSETARFEPLCKESLPAEPAPVDLPQTEIDSSPAEPPLLLPPPIQTAENHDVADEAVPATSAPPASAARADVLDNPSLDRLIVRHRVHHRRRLARWLIASGAMSALFAGAVAWASRTIDFGDGGLGAFLFAQPNVQPNAQPDAQQGKKNVRGEQLNVGSAPDVDTVP